MNETFEDIQQPGKVGMMQPGGKGPTQARKSLESENIKATDGSALDASNLNMLQHDQNASINNELTSKPQAIMSTQGPQITMNLNAGELIRNLN